MAKWNKSETLMLLALYEEHPFLYNSSDPNYFNKGLRRLKLNEICSELKKSKKDATVEEIKYKIKTLRSQLLKEKRLIEDSEKAGKEYVPSLWSYRHMTFLDSNPTDSLSSQPTLNSEIITCEESEEDDYESEKRVEIAFESPAKKKNTVEFREEATNAFEYARSFAEQVLQNRAKVETKESIFAKYLCDKLKLIKSEYYYEDTTWKILQVVREGIKKDKREREWEDMEEDFDEARKRKSNPDGQRQKRVRSNYDNTL